MKKLIVLGLMALPCFASNFEPVQTSYDFAAAPEYQAILANLKSLGEFETKATPTTIEPEKPKTMSKGEQAVEEAKARNRAILADMAKTEKARNEDTRSQLEKWKAEERDTLNQWKKETKDQLNQWKREQEIFLGRIKVYKENTFVIPAPKEKIVEKKIPVEAIPDVHIVNGTFKVAMKDQSSRPTCVAFAGIRAIEILLAQNNVNQDLSEQYLYWAGKPKCQVAPCAEKGSWIREAYRYSSKQPSIDIPEESTCSYKSESVANNETQLPMAETCKSGVVKVSDFKEVKTIAEVIESVKKDVPVVIAAKLSENFYKNKGLVTLAESSQAGSDIHALGHAFLAVGVMELPKNLRATEGDFCIVVANSWGKGWGAGGYSCVTQKWFEKYRQPSAFISPTRIATR
jgi:C1A family cysteine protease